MLDPIKSKLTICESKIWDTCKRRLNKCKEREAISVYKVVQSNSSIIINPNNADKEPHAENYGKSNSYFVIKFSIFNYFTDYDDEDDDDEDNDDNVDNASNYLIVLDFVEVKPKYLKQPPLEDHYIIRIYKKFCSKLARPILPPNYRILDCFRYWLANSLGYQSGTFRWARFALQDYLKESGYNLTEHVRKELCKTVLRIKKKLISSKIKDKAKRQ
jgi:hypothetical protein